VKRQLLQSCRLVKEGRIVGSTDRNEVQPREWGGALEWR